MDPSSTTLGAALAHAARTWPDKIALIGVDRQITWSELDREVTRAAHLWSGLGIRRGDAVALCTTKCPEVVVAFLALARIGAIAAPVNYKLEPRWIRDQFETGNLRGALLDARFDAVVAPVRDRIDGRVLYVGEAGALAGRPWAEVGDQPVVPVEPQLSADEVIYYNYTSGTTGRPKGALGSHANVLWNAWSGVQSLGFRGDDVFMCLFSVFSHPHELFHRALLTGATCVVVDTLSPRVVAQTVAAHGVTWIMAVPSFYEMMLDYVETAALDVSSLRVLEAGGAWVSPATLDRLEERLDCTFMPVWGSTETHGVALAAAGPDRVRGSTGFVVAGYEVSLLDERQRPVPDGGVGELWVRGAAVTSGYVGMPQSSGRAVVDGWYRTSDLLRRDANGALWFVGRRTDMLKVGGIRVFPLEIEQALADHPDVVEAAVVRAEERVRGEVPRAVVRVRGGVSRQDLLGWCRQRLAAFKVPRILEIWHDLPRLPNGKVDRLAIAASAADPARDDR